MKLVLMSAILALGSGSALAQSTGWWEEPIFWFGPTQQDAIEPVHLIHVVVGGQGKVLAYGRGSSCETPDAVLWTPPPIGSPPGSSGTFESVPLDRTDLFCAGHSALADGRIFHAGGEVAFSGTWCHRRANIFDPAVAPAGPGSWNTLLTPPDMDEPRWYPTVTTLWDNTVLVTSGRTLGTSQNWIPELFNPAYDPNNPSEAWTQLTSAERLQSLYPWMFLLPSGHIFEAGPLPSYNGDGRILRSSVWTPAPWTWQSQRITSPPNVDPPWRRGTGVMYEPGKVMKCGGRTEDGSASVKSTWVVDLSTYEPGQQASWSVAGEMENARRNHNLVILPDGKVVAVGGNEEGERIDPVHAAEIWDPATLQWTEQPESDTTQGRWYHSTAMLLPDGRVVSAGGDNHPTGQFFYPPYFVGDPPRAFLENVPTEISYGDSFTIDVTMAIPGQTEPFDFHIVGAALIRLASTTHGFDMDQRYVPLEYFDLSGFNWVETKEVLLESPLNGNIAPPGYYMLWILTETDDFPGLKVPVEMAAYVRLN